MCLIIDDKVTDEADITQVPIKCYKVYNLTERESVKPTFWQRFCKRWFNNFVFYSPFLGNKYVWLGDEMDLPPVKLGINPYIDYTIVESGYHTTAHYTNIDTLLSQINGYKVVFECEIPAGSKYLKGTWGSHQIPSYASSDLTLLRHLKEFK